MMTRAVRIPRTASRSLSATFCSSDACAAAGCGVLLGQGTGLKRKGADTDTDVSICLCGVFTSSTGRNSAGSHPLTLEGDSTHLSLTISQ